MVIWMVRSELHKAKPLWSVEGSSNSYSFYTISSAKKIESKIYGIIQKAKNKNKAAD